MATGAIGWTRQGTPGRFSSPSDQPAQSARTSLQMRTAMPKKDFAAFHKPHGAGYTGGQIWVSRGLPIPFRSFRMQRASSRGFTLVELMVVVAIIGLLASVLATSVVSKMKQASRELDKKVLQDLYNHLHLQSQGDKNKEKLIRGPIAEKRGREFWEACFQHKLLDVQMLPKLIAKSGQDLEMDRRSLDNPEMFVLDPLGCSWTGPQGNEALTLMSLRGPSRRIVICSNERNWFNHDDDVLTIWSDGEVAEYIGIEQLSGWGYEITQEQWLRPGAELFGNTAPFDGVFD
jgi:prepilin-type N-terminal cleavage/methylation domain-containing protein